MVVPTLRSLSLCTGYSGIEFGVSLTSDKLGFRPEIRRIVEEYRPSLVFCENVSSHLSNGFKTVVENMKTLGYVKPRTTPHGVGKKRPTILTALSYGQTREGAGRVRDDASCRVDCLHAIGNGVVPAAAARAFIELKRLQ